MAIFEDLLATEDDFAWLNFVNTWVGLKRIEGYFDMLEAKWLPKS